MIITKFRLFENNNTKLWDYQFFDIKDNTILLQLKNEDGWEDEKEMSRINDKESTKILDKINSLFGNSKISKPLPTNKYLLNIELPANDYYDKFFIYKDYDDYFYIDTEYEYAQCDTIEGLLQFLDHIKSKGSLYTESISGTELIGHMGPNYGETQLPVTLSQSDTSLVYVGDKIYSEDEYNDLYQQYLTKGGKPLFGFSKQNLEMVLSKLGTI